MKSYRNDTGFLGHMYTDPERNVYKALQVIRVNNSSELKGDGTISEYSINGTVSGMLWSGYKMISSGFSTGDINQLGAVFVLDNGKALFHYFEKSPEDHPKIENIFKAGGAKL